MDYPSTRAEAKATGATHYFTGKPCKHGHVAPRRTKGNCIECDKEAWKNDPRIGSGEKSDAAKAAGRRHYLRNREEMLARAKAQPAEKTREYKNRHKKKNPDYYKLLTNTRRRRLRDATPPWLSAEDKAKIKELYKQALEVSKLTGEQYEVDHIIPLQGETVSGLHVPWNLQLLHYSDNRSKSNSLDPTTQ